MPIKNAKIDKTVLTSNEGHGIPSCMLYLSYGGSTSQGFGGYDLRYHGIKMITRIIETVGEEEWEDLPGKYIRVKTNTDDKIVAIGHITEEKWYNPEEEDKKTPR